ncbi:spore cortex biosynthesis protein YabQ [Paenibacillus sp. MBLB4367]|uniref:spore cortex biosynthesis protein YabQ n=1 Tax=Paenibacillus sp. MBLB4367 TaxID=3384767 RepID=UPI00390800BA
MTLNEQFLTLGLMFGCGWALGILFDTYRVLTGQLRLPRLLIHLLDLIFWLTATLLVFRVLFYSNYGQVRLFVFIGLVAGGSFHYCFTTGITVKLVMGIIRVVKWLYKLLLRTIDLFIVTPIIWIYKLVIAILGFLAAAAMFLGKIVLQLLYPFKAAGAAILRFIVKRLGLSGMAARWANGAKRGWSRLKGWLFDKKE